MGAGSWKRVSAVASATSVLLACALLVTYFLDWHVVRRTDALDLRPLLCAMTPDCAPLATGGSGASAVPAVCTGWSHADSPLGLVALVAMLAVALSGARSDALAVHALRLASGLCAAAVTFHDAFLAHFLDRVERLPAEHAFGWMLMAWCAGAALRLAFAVVARVRQRRRAASPASTREPSA